MAFGKTMAIPTLAVTDLARARQFYGDTLGFEEIRKEDKAGATFKVGDGYLCLYERPTPSGSTATACAFTVDDVEGTVADLRSRGVKFEEYDLPEMGIKTKDGIAELEGVESAWFKDPFGNILAIEDSFSALLPRGEAEQQKAPSAEEHPYA